MIRLHGVGKAHGAHCSGPRLQVRAVAQRTLRTEGRKGGGSHRRARFVYVTSPSLALLAALALAACHGRSPVDPAARPQVSLAASDWQFLYSPGMPARPSPESGGGWSFAFPLDPGSVNYVVEPVLRAADERQVVTATWVIDCDPGTELNGAVGHGAGTDANPATASLMLERVGDEDMTDSYGRWWGGRTVLVCGGQQTVTVPLVPGAWSSVYGGTDPRQFAASIAAIWRVGVTFGGAYFAGHGCNVTAGRARFRLVEFGIR